jgi:hypothetical protein
LLQGITSIEEQVKKLSAKQLLKSPTAEDIATQLEPKICQSICFTMSKVILDRFSPLPPQQYQPLAPPTAPNGYGSLPPAVPPQQYTNQPPQQYAYQPSPLQPTSKENKSWW